MPSKIKGPNFERRTQRNTRAIIGKRIAQQRQLLGMTQTQLAEAFGVSRAAVSQYEVGIGEINAGDLEFLAEILRVPISYFYLAPSEDEKIKMRMEAIATYFPHLPEMQQEIIMHTILETHTRLAVSNGQGSRHNAILLRDDFNRDDSKHEDMEQDTP